MQKYLNEPTKSSNQFFSRPCSSTIIWKRGTNFPNPRSKKQDQHYCNPPRQSNFRPSSLRTPSRATKASPAIARQFSSDQSFHPTPKADSIAAVPARYLKRFPSDCFHRTPLYNPMSTTRHQPSLFVRLFAIR